MNDIEHNTVWWVSWWGWEDPNEHLSRFLQMCSTFKVNCVSDDAIRLHLFPFSLKALLIDGLHHLFGAQSRLGKTCLASFLGCSFLQAWPQNWGKKFWQSVRETLRHHLKLMKDLKISCGNVHTTVLLLGYAFRYYTTGWTNKPVGLLMPQLVALWVISTPMMLKSWLKTWKIMNLIGDLERNRPKPKGSWDRWQCSSRCQNWDIGKLSWPTHVQEGKFKLHSSHEMWNMWRRAHCHSMSHLSALGYPNGTCGLCESRAKFLRKPV